MPATTELKLFSNCWHFLFFKYSFLCPFGLSISTDYLKYISRKSLVLQCPFSRAFHFYNSSQCSSEQEKLQCPVSRVFLFYLFVHQNKELEQNCCNAQYLGLSFSIRHRPCVDFGFKVVMPSISGCSFLRYPLKTIVKSMVSSTIFVINSQNILKFIISLPVFGFPVFLLT